MSSQNDMILPAMLAATAIGVGIFNGIGVTLIRIAPLVMTLGTADVITSLLVAPIKIRLFATSEHYARSLSMLQWRTIRS